VKLLERVPRKRRFPAVCLATAALAVPLAAWGRGETHAGGDLITFHLPHWETIRRDLSRHGSAPLWDFFQYGGTPLAGSGQDVLSFPPYRLMARLPSTVVLEILVALFLAWCAWGTYRLIRSYRAGREASVLGAIAYTLSFTLMGRVAAGHFGVLAVLCQAPLLLYLIRRLILRPSCERAMRVALAGALLLLVGHPSFLYQLGVLAAALAIAELAGARRESRPVGRPLLLISAALAAALLMSALHLLPILEVRSHATRGSLDASALYAHNPPDFSFTPRDLTTFWLPLYPRADFVQGDRFEFYWFEKAVYAGLLPLLAAGFVALHPWPRGARFLGMVFVIALADGMNRHLPVHAVLCAVLPGYGSFRVPARAVWMCTLTLSLLAALGWDRAVSRSLEPARRRRVIGAGAVAALGVGLALAIRFGIHGELAILGALLAAGIGLLVLAGRHPIGSSRAVLLLTGIELLAQALAVLPTAPRSSLDEPLWYVKHLGTDLSSYRVLDLTEGGYIPARHGVRNMNGYGYPVLDATRRLYASAWEVPPKENFNTLGTGGRIVHPRPLDLLNVGWVLARGAPPEEGLVEVARREEIVLYRRPSACPYAFAGPHEAGAERAADTIRVRLRLSVPETLVISESWMPGWRARVGFQPAVVRPFEGALLSIDLPAGEHEVVLAYEPSPHRIGRWISVIAAVAVLTTLLVSCLRWRRAAQPLAPPSGA